MRKITIHSGRKIATIVFPTIYTIDLVCDFINKFDLFQELLSEIEEWGYVLESLELGENLISGDNGIITIEDEPIVIY